MAKPTHNVCIREADDNRWYLVGVAWQDPATGRITTKLNPFVDLGRMKPDDHLMLFPRRPFGDRSEDFQKPEVGPDLGNDSDIPF